MKQIIILLLLIIAFFIGFGKYQQYKRYNTPKLEYKTDKKIDIEFHNQDLVFNYFNAIEDLNSWVKLQWTANNIDVVTPEDDGTETKFAVKKYAEKLAKIKYYEARLEKSAFLKEKGFSNKEIKFLEETGTGLKTHLQEIEKTSFNNKLKTLFADSKKIVYNQKTALIYEVQKLLVKNGFDIAVDGIYKAETSNAIKSFEAKNNLFADGKLDLLTLDALLE
ncbi:peptidoglycan-binding domain-containing protein [Polaribacter cellanae]|uniref:Peptidoglycan-binding protein n=1 Tax=Polaribacter cellanae TaxID=2818493 RepID=A0A975H6Y0_9FLAO|nr:peptidoglycan-binding domain-containing protein [Polaribacter cellanae]QTE22483.1 peptidoglycan-binding protein [Polaribacter cellanae]